MLALQAVVALLLGTQVVQSSQRLTPNAKHRAWEYKVEQINGPNLEDRLNQLGKQGWELISTDKAIDGYDVTLKR
jgi:hypothetical protein